MIEDHGNEGQDWVFLAKHKESETEFRVDVAVEADYEQSGNIQEVDWDTLQVEFDQETESLEEMSKSELMALVRETIKSLIFKMLIN